MRNMALPLNSLTMVGCITFMILSTLPTCHTERSTLMTQDRTDAITSLTHSAPLNDPAISPKIIINSLSLFILILIILLTMFSQLQPYSNQLVFLSEPFLVAQPAQVAWVAQGLRLSFPEGRGRSWVPRASPLGISQAMLSHHPLGLRCRGRCIQRRDLPAAGGRGRAAGHGGLAGDL